MAERTTRMAEARSLCLAPFAAMRGLLVGKDRGAGLRDVSGL